MVHFMANRLCQFLQMGHLKKRTKPNFWLGGDSWWYEVQSVDIFHPRLLLHRSHRNLPILHHRSNCRGPGTWGTIPRPYPATSGISIRSPYLTPVVLGTGSTTGCCIRPSPLHTVLRGMAGSGVYDGGGDGVQGRGHGAPRDADGDLREKRLRRLWPGARK